MMQAFLFICGRWPLFLSLVFPAKKKAAQPQPHRLGTAAPEGADPSSGKKAHQKHTDARHQNAVEHEHGPVLLGHVGHAEKAPH